MGRIVATEYISVDGVIEAPSGPSDFARAGWTDAYTRGPDGDAYMHAQGMEAAALLMGRLTYEPFAAACRFGDCTHTTEPGCAVLVQAADESTATRTSERAGMSTEVSMANLLSAAN